jgi:solute carrier family 23 (nucleobase transporter), member 1
VTYGVSVTDQTRIYETSEQTTEKPWHSRMREIQGAILTASILEAFIGLTGLVGILVRVIGPLTVAPIITIVGLALVEVGADHCASNWWIALL